MGVRIRWGQLVKSLREDVVLNKQNWKGGWSLLERGLSLKRSYSLERGVSLKRSYSLKRGGSLKRRQLIKM